MARWIFIIIAVAILAAAGLGAAKFYSDRAEKAGANFRTVTVDRGDVMPIISATGTIEPREVVDVGAQVAGQIISFGKDSNGKLIDYRSPVEEGMVLAQIDPELYQADFQSTNAQIEQAEAGVVRAQADLGQAKAKLIQAERDWDRAQKLGPSDALAATSYDSYKAAYDIGLANVAVSEAAVKQAQSTVTQNRAALTRVQRNLGYCTIKSPVKGVIIDRRVNIGQTVVSSLNAPSLFLIATDLNQLELWVPVNEADIGNVREGQDVSFTVDAFPGVTFHGRVEKVRLNAVMTQNVVTYTVEVATDNPDGKLLPYLTANVQFEVGRREGVLRVPNAALRWSPRPELITADSSADGGGGGGGGGRGEGRGRRGGGGGAGAGGGPTTRRANAEATRGTVWVASGESVKGISVRLGAADSGYTEILGENLPEGTQVIVGEQRAESAAPTGPASPFMPTFPRGGGRRGGF
jgi:HlyD family secretion protein